MSLRSITTLLATLIGCGLAAIVSIGLTQQPAPFPRDLMVPVKGVHAADIQDTFNDARGTERKHEATDILAARGTEVVAADDGIIKKLFLSKPGGNTIYQFDPTEQFCYYYAHLDRYAEGLDE